MKKVVLLLGLMVSLVSCSGSNDDTNGTGGNPKGAEGFDKTALLTNWADNIIIPSFQDYQSKLSSLKTATDAFVKSPNNTTLQTLRSSWLAAYKSYQHVALFEVGKAMQSDYSLRMFSDTYPVQLGPNPANGDLNGINENIVSGNYSFTTISSADEQGFPALDYMINGLGSEDTVILEFYTTNTNASGYKQYLTGVTNRLKSVADDIITDWTSNYRTSYINSNGTTASSSVNITVNAFVKAFEKDIRAGKVGIPSGVYSSGILYADKVEAFYKNDVSKVLLNESIQASYDFFNGKGFTNGTEGPSLKTYLDYVHVIRDGQNLSDIINSQFEAISKVNGELQSSFSQQITTDNSKMISSFNAMQQNVIYFKLDMMQALNIAVDYVDNDGD